MKIKDITNCLEQLAPLSYQESYDNAGLIVGHPDDTVTKALICLDSTEEIIDEAIAQGCDLVIAHHPIVFTGLKKLNGKNYVERTIIKAIKNNIAIYAIHTNLDNVVMGVNDMIGKRLGLVNTTVLQPKRNLLKKLIVFVPIPHTDTLAKALFAAGAGHIGNYSEASFSTEGKGTFKGNEKSNPTIGEKEALEIVDETRLEMIFPAMIETNIIRTLLAHHPYEEVAYDIISLDNWHPQVGAGMIGELAEPMDTADFLMMVKTQLQTACIRHTQIISKTVKKIAVCGGSGSFLLTDAIRQKADVFITADYKYHQFFDADGRILIADVGHYESEQFTKELIFEHLSQKLPNFATHFSITNTNPIKYL